MIRGLVAPSIWRGTLKTLYVSCAAGYEDYLAVGAALLPPPRPHPHAPDYTATGATPCYNGVISPDAMWNIFPRGPSGTGSIVQLTITTVYSILKRSPVRWERVLMGCNRGHPQWSVAAMIMGINALHPGLREYVLAQEMHHTPLALWPVVYKDWFTALRRCPILHSNRSVPPSEVLMLRKAFTCCVRVKVDADWEAEKMRRTRNMPVHFGVTSDGHLSRHVWHADLHATLHTLTSEIVSETVRSARLDRASRWWESRWAWTPSGSSSARYRADHIKTADERLASGARPNKKSVFEELPDDYYEKLISCYPKIYVARASSKHEPGKLAGRALYAVADEPFIISSYASVHMEKHMNIWGIKAKQTPADVVDWISVGLRRPPRSTWVSLDYSDYNTEHEHGTLYKLNEQLAVAWLKHAEDPIVRRDKATASMWCATAHMQAWVEGAGDEPWRAFSGLFSGDRDTARDNTLLHGVYSRMALRYTQIVDPSAAILSANYTGDDEDTLMNDWVSASIYLGMHSHMGFVLKPAKQMVSAVIHEFLQRLTVPDALPTRPLFATLSQYASGNWYKDVFLWYDAAVQSVSDNVWEMVTRGLPVIYGRRLAVETLNAMMRVPITSRAAVEAPELSALAAPGVKTPIAWKQLEWWPYRNSGSTVHPLWYGTIGDSVPGPAIEAKPRPHSSVSALATKSWVHLKKLDIPIHNAKGWMQYEEMCTKESYSGLYVGSRADAHRTFALDVWPTRSTKPGGLEVPAPNQPDYQRIATMILSVPVERRPARESEVLARMGLDAPLVAALGGLRTVLPSLEPHMMRHYSRPDTVGYQPLEMAWLDPAIKSWYSATGMSQIDRPADYERRLQRYWPKPILSHNVDDAVPRYVFLAPNCAGKSTFISTRPWCADSDAVFSTLTLVQATHVNSKLQFMPRPEALAQAVGHVLARQGYSGITTQMSPNDVLPYHTDRPFTVKLIVVRPDNTLLIPRMQQRGWDAAKIARRLARWDGMLERFLSHPSVLSPAETKAIEFHTHFPSTF